MTAHAPIPSQTKNAEAGKAIFPASAVPGKTILAISSVVRGLPKRIIYFSPRPPIYSIGEPREATAGPLSSIYGAKVSSGASGVRGVAFAGGVGTLRAWKFALFPQIKLSERMRVFDLGECF